MGIYYDLMTDEETLFMAQMLLNGYQDDEGNNVDPQSHVECVRKMQLIDDHLSLMRNRQLLLRKKGIRQMLDARISLELGKPENVASLGLNNK